MGHTHAQRLSLNYRHVFPAKLDFMSLIHVRWENVIMPVQYNNVSTQQSINIAFDVSMHKKIQKTMRVPLRTGRRKSG